jgi:hypothetical protein
MVTGKAGAGLVWSASIKQVGDAILDRDVTTPRLTARMAEAARILALLPRAAEVSKVAVSPRATKSPIPVIGAATRIRIAEAANSADKVKTVVAGLVDAKFLRSRFPEAAQQDEMAAATRVPTVGPVAEDAVKPKPSVARRRAVAMSRASAARATSLKKTRLPIH